MSLKVKEKDRQDVLSTLSEIKPEDIDREIQSAYRNIEVLRKKTRMNESNRESSIKCQYAKINYLERRKREIEEPKKQGENNTLQTKEG